jgi:hypothetical protein
VKILSGDVSFYSREEIHSIQVGEMQAKVLKRASGSEEIN